MIKAICFDLDGVYFLDGKANFIAELEKLGISNEEAKRVFLKSDEMNKQYKHGTLTDEQYWTWALGEWKLDKSVNDIVDLLIQGYKINEPAVDYVKKIKQAGYKPVICSNNFPARIKGLDQRFNFLAAFDAAMFSYECGISKPNRAIFEELVKRSQVLPTEIVYSDDDETKMSGAQELGINTVVYTNFENFVAYLNTHGVNV